MRNIIVISYPGIMREVRSHALQCRLHAACRATLLLIIPILFLALPVAAVWAQKPDQPPVTAPVTARPLGELLNPDGTLRTGAANGTGIDPRGWQLRTHADGTPYFTPQASQSSAAGVPDDDNWDSRFGSFSMDGNIYAMAVIGTDIYIGGSFDTVGTIEAHRLARWDGTGWQPVGGAINGFVYAMAVDGGNLYVGGQFTGVGTIDASNIAVWNTASGGWSALDGGVTAEGYSYVSSVAVGASEVYVGGSFTNAGSVQTSNIARWNKSARSWAALGPAGANGTNGEVLAVKANGNDLWVGGNFNTAGGATALNAARWDIGAKTWNVLGSGLDGYVNAIGVAKYGVYFGGGFNYAGSEYVSNFARWSTKWRFSGAYGYVRDILFVPPLVYVTGEFRRVSRDESDFNVVNNYVGAFGQDVSDAALDDPSAQGYIQTWRPFGQGILNGMDGYTNAVAFSGATAYFGGSFRVAGSEIRGRIAQWDTVAHRWRAFGVSISGPVQAIAQFGNDVYLAGTFEPRVGQSISTIVKWDGNRWSFVETNIDGTINALAVWHDNLYAGGRFKHIRNVWCNNVAAYSLATQTWAPLDTGVVNLDSTDIPFVGSIAAYDNDVYFGGYFTVARGVVLNNIARWNIGDRQWHALRNGVSGIVRTVAVDDGGTPYIGGALAVPGDTSTFNLARWDGDRWRVVGDGIWGSVAAIKFHNGDLYVGGNFRGAGHDSINYIARWDGSRWNGFGNWTDGRPSTSVNTIAFDGNDMYVAGNFESIGGDSINYIAKWDGNRWSPLGSGTDDGIYAIAAVGSDLYAGGAFLLAGQKPSLYFARWLIHPSSVAAPTVTDPGETLEQNTPNPFAAQTAITFKTERPGHVTLKVFDIEGNEVATLVSGYRPAGTHDVIWRADNVAQGTYYYRLQCGSQVETRKLMVVR